MALPNIGLIGKLRAGKDEVAKHLAETHGYMRFAFGDGLKRHAHELFGYPKPGEKPRELYQWFGQTMRERDPDIWVRKCLERVQNNAGRPVERSEGWGWESHVVITDVRQPNEFSALKAAGYTLIRVDAPDAVRIQRAIESGDMFNYSDLMHGTETALDGYEADFTVDNSGSLAELYAQIDAIMAALGDQRCAA